MRFLAFFLISLLALISAGHAETLRFNRDIRPILSDKCFACHGFDAKHRKADLRLDTPDGAAEVIKTGDFWERILTTDPDDIMPPPETHKSLTAAQKATLHAWIEQGAPYEPHWSFVPLSPVPVPAVKQNTWPTQDLDRFILARLEAEKLAPSAPATKETLIRRVTLDLTGLPPSPAEVDAFLADASPTAYEKVVDRLLQSPHYGERMAVDWLDAARYADSNGYQVDRDREMWPWRDWVIRAFNDNQPFDQFTLEQLAGDLLPNPTLDQRIATGFHRNHMMNEEGGIIGEEFLAEYTADRVETTASVWLAQTFNCARCHDHKFDPITQRDFYAMKAFFHNVPERGVGIYSAPIRQNSPPFVRLPAPEIEKKLAEMTARLTSMNGEMKALAATAEKEVEGWTQRVNAQPVVWQSVPVTASEQKANRVKLTAKLTGEVTALRLICHAGDGAVNLQWTDLKVAGKLPRAIAVDDSLPAAEVAKALDDDRRSKTAIAVKPKGSVIAAFMLDSAPSPEFVLELGIENTGAAATWHLEATASHLDLLAPTEIKNLAKQHPRSAADQKKLAEFHLSQQPAYYERATAVEKLKKEIATAEGEIPTSLVMEEMKEPRPTFVLTRGQYDKPEAAVTAATPSVLPPLAKGEPANRLGLAHWLVAAENPLTARVTVNRLWQQVFGAGLVRSSEDFGSQGEPPSHPELLDWLAMDFRAHGWDVKRFMKQLVMSSTYRQESQLTAALRERDLENRLIARGSRYRLMAEAVRDQALAASGLLVRKLGGPSVKPYHPPGLYEQVTAGNGYNIYVPGKGDDLHRRSMYTYWKRSVPHPGMLLFDAPFREGCTLRRPRTNTPLQALNLMNDPTYVEAARFLAQRMMRETGPEPTARLTHGFRLVLARSPQPAELELLQRGFERSRKDFEADPQAAEAFLNLGEAKADPALNRAELAAYATLASLLLNLDETVTKE